MDTEFHRATPLVSIITVTLNATDTIDRTLASVKEQTFTNYEFIVIDGGSTDNTLDKVRTAGIKNISIVSEKDRGIYDAMNKGLEMAFGNYVIFLNAGDAFHTPNTLHLIADAIINNDFPGIVYGQTDIIDNEGHKLYPRHLSAPSHLTLDSFKDGMVVCHQAFVALRKITGPFDLRYRFSADVDWCIRCLQHSKHNVYIDDVIIDFLNEGATSRNHRRSLIERFKIMCYYYGTLSTIMRHIKFIPRYLKGNSSKASTEG